MDSWVEESEVVESSSEESQVWPAASHTMDDHAATSWPLPPSFSPP